MNFLADENVEKPVVDTLRRDGHDVLYLCEITSRTIDEQILQQANAESRILLTNDKDFGELIFLQGKSTEGILLMRFVSDKSSIKVHFVESLMRTHADRLRGYFTVLSEGKLRRRPLR